MLARLTPFRSVNRRSFLELILEEAINISEYFRTRKSQGLVASLVNNNAFRVKMNCTWALDTAWELSDDNINSHMTAPMIQRPSCNSSAEGREDNLMSLESTFMEDQYLEFHP